MLSQSVIDRWGNMMRSATPQEMREHLAEEVSNMDAGDARMAVADFSVLVSRLISEKPHIMPEVFEIISSTSFSPACRSLVMLIPAIIMCATLHREEIDVGEFLDELSQRHKSGSLTVDSIDTMVERMKGKAKR